MKKFSTIPNGMILLACLGMVWVAGCSNGDEKATQQGASQGTDAKPRITASGLGIVDVLEGKGTPAIAGDTVSVQYTGRLKDGTKFDSSYDSNKPFEFPLGAGHVIKGWDEGVTGMKVGGKRKLIIPPDLGYGAEGTPGGPIPPNATLYFDVELVAISH